MCIGTLEALEAQCLAGSSTPPWRRPARRVAVLIPRPAPLEAYGGKIRAGPSPPAPLTSSSHVPLRTQALRKHLSLRDKSFQKKMVGPCGAGRRSARSKTFQPVNATYVALTRRTAPRWPPGQKNFPTRGAYAPSRESGGSSLPLPLQGREGPPVGARRSVPDLVSAL